MTGAYTEASNDYILLGAEGAEQWKVLLHSVILANPAESPSLPWQSKQVSSEQKSRRPEDSWKRLCHAPGQAKRSMATGFGLGRGWPLVPATRSPPACCF